MRKFELVMTDDGEALNINCVNEGFTAFELIGVLEEKKLDIIKQINGDKKYVHTRTLVKENEVVDIEEVEKND